MPAGQRYAPAATTAKTANAAEMIASSAALLAASGMLLGGAVPVRGAVLIARCQWARVAGIRARGALAAP